MVKDGNQPHMMVIRQLTQVYFSHLRRDFRNFLQFILAPGVLNDDGCALK